MKRNQRGILIMVMAAAFLASSTILLKQIPLLTNLKPRDVAIWRFSIATPFFWMFYILKNKGVERTPGRPWRLLGLGCVFAFASFCAIFALSRLSSSLYIIIVYIYPTLITLFSLIFGGRVPKLFWFGIPLTLVGIILLSIQTGSDLKIDPVGFAITIVNAFAMAAYFYLSGRLFKTIQNKLLGTSWVMTGAMVAGLLMIPFLGVQMPESIKGWILLFLLSFFGTLFPILATNVGLQMIGAARGGVIVTIQPLLTGLFSMIVFNEKLSILQWVGGLLVIAAVVILQLSPDRPEKKSLST